MIQEALALLPQVPPEVRMAVTTRRSRAAFLFLRQFSISDGNRAENA